MHFVLSSSEKKNEEIAENESTENLEIAISCVLPKSRPRQSCVQCDTIENIETTSRKKRKKEKERN